MIFDFSKWNISCDKEYYKCDLVVFCDVKFVLVFLNCYLFGDCCGEVVVVNDGSFIILYLVDS